MWRSNKNRIKHFLANFSIGKYRKWIKVDEVFNTKFGNKTAPKKNTIFGIESKCSVILPYLRYSECILRNEMLKFDYKSYFFNLMPGFNVNH